MTINFDGIDNSSGEYLVSPGPNMPSAVVTISYDSTHFVYSIEAKYDNAVIECKVSESYLYQCDFTPFEFAQKTMLTQFKKFNDVVEAAKTISDFNEAASFQQLSTKLPGMNEQVTCPVETCVNHVAQDFNGTMVINKVRKSEKLYYIVQHLNDLHKWTREAIADWLDASDLDLRFKSETSS